MATFCSDSRAVYTRLLDRDLLPVGKKLMALNVHGLGTVVAPFLVSIADEIDTVVAGMYMLGMVQTVIA